MFQPATWTRTGLIAPADIASEITRPLRRRCTAHRQDHGVSKLRSGPDSGLAVSMIGLANTVCTTTRPRRLQRAVNHEDQQLIARKAGRGSAPRKSRAVQIWRTPRQRSPVQRGHTALGTRLRWISGHDLTTGQ
jgi:hypothetical protein